MTPSYLGTLKTTIVHPIDVLTRLAVHTAPFAIDDVVPLDNCTQQTLSITRAA